MASRTRAKVTKLAVGYLRRSTDRQEQSIKDQRKAIEAFAERGGYEVLDYYVDDAISGASSDGREAFQRMIADAQRDGCTFGSVLVYDVKRFGRLDNDETGHYRYLLKQAGVEVIYISENFSGDDTDDLIRPVKQWQARQELKDLSKVTIRGLISKSQTGFWVGGVPPYGYDLEYYTPKGEFLMRVRFMQDGGKQILEPDGTLQRELEPGNPLMISKQDRARLVLSSRDRVKAVRDIFTWYIRDGLGYKGIADRLNSLGIPSPLNGRRGSGKWCMTTIREMVANPIYTGDMTWNRRSMAKFHRIKGKIAVPAPKIRRRVVEENDEEDWIVCPGSHPSIIPRELFRKAQAKRLERRAYYRQNYRRGRGARSGYLLTGVIKCIHCGHNWQGYSILKGKPRDDGSRVITEYYACGGYVGKGNSVCQRKLIGRQAIEGMVLGEIGRNLAGFLGGENGRAALKKALEEIAGQEGDGVGKEIQKLQRRKADLERRIYNILDNITADNREFADARIRELKKELSGILPRLEELEAQSSSRPDPDELTDALLGYMGEFDKVLAEGTVDEKRSFIRAFTRKIELDPVSEKGRAELLTIPDLAAMTRCGPTSAHSSLMMVAGAS